MSLAAVPTPALLADRAALERNVREMAARAAAAGTALWPHAKTHKCTAIAERQREHGAAGVTVSTLPEAEHFAAAGWEDLLLAFPPAGEERRRAAAELAGRVRLRVALDDADTAAALADACRAAGTRVEILWEVDSGARRLGTPPGEPSAAAIAALGAREETPFAGILTFGGHSYGARDDAELAAAARDEREALRATAAALERRGIECPVRSLGSTPTCHLLAPGSGATEARPGNYVFHDATQVALGVVGEDRCALDVLATVVSRPDPCRLILDAGSKALAAERLTDRAPGLGLVRGHPELLVERLYEQHAIVTGAAPVDVPVGARLRVIPNHACAAANLHRELLLVEDDRVVDAWAIGPRGPGATDLPAGEAVPLSTATQEQTR